MGPRRGLSFSSLLLYRKSVSACSSLSGAVVGRLWLVGAAIAEKGGGALAYESAAAVLGRVCTELLGTGKGGDGPADEAESEGG